MDRTPYDDIFKNSLDKRLAPGVLFKTSIE